MSNTNNESESENNLPQNLATTFLSEDGKYRLVLNLSRFVSNQYTINRIVLIHPNKDQK